MNLWGFGPQFCQALQALALGGRGGGAAAPAGGTRARPGRTSSSTSSSPPPASSATVDRRPAAVRDQPGPGLHRRRPQLHQLADRRREDLPRRRRRRSRASPATSARRRCCTCTCGTRSCSATTTRLRPAPQRRLPRTRRARRAEARAAVRPRRPTPRPPARAGSRRCSTPSPRSPPARTMLVCDYITANLLGARRGRRPGRPAGRAGRAGRAPTAALERAFAEHVDLCSYRYDAWLLALVNYQLEADAGAASRPTGRPEPQSQTPGGDLPGRLRVAGGPAPVTGAAAQPAQLPPGLDDRLRRRHARSSPTRRTAATCTRPR